MNNNNSKRRIMRGFTADGYVRVQRTVLRRVITDRLQALLRGDFYVRNSLGGEEYEPIVNEVKTLIRTTIDNATASTFPLPQAPAVASATVGAVEMGDSSSNNKNQHQNGHHVMAKKGLTNGSGAADNNDIIITKKDETPLPPQNQSLSFSTNLETFLQLIAASIMIDASMRGENSGESDTRFIKKKKKLLVKTLMGPKLADFCKEVLRFDTVRQGGMVSDTELVESEESQSSESSSSGGGESSSEDEEVEANEKQMTMKKKKKVKIFHSTSNDMMSSQPMKIKSQDQPRLKQMQVTATATETAPKTASTSASSVVPVADVSSHTAQLKQHRHHQSYPSSGGDEGSSSMDEEDEDNSTTDSNEDGVSSSANNSNDAEETSMMLSLDGFSASASSSRKQQRKLEKKMKRLKKERKRMKKEERRRRKERKRREKEERKLKRKAEKEEKRRLMMEQEQQQQQAGLLKDSKKKKKRKHNKSDATDDDADNEASDVSPRHNRHGEDGVDNMEYITSLSSSGKHRHSIPNEDFGGAESDEDDVEEEGEDVLATKEEFEQYKSDILKRVPKSVKSRFRQGGFSRWGKDWLPILELGPFDVEPGPVRDMWFDMFNNTQASGRDMTRLVLWYGVKFEDRGQAYSFLPESKIVQYEEGQRNGYCKIPPKIKQKIEKNQKLTKTEEQIRRGLIEIEADMARDKSGRAAWMMHFKENYEYAEEEAAKKAKKKLAKAGEKEVSPPVENAIKRKPGRPKKDETAVPIKRKPGRPKKVVVDVTSAEEDDHVVVEVKKRGPGRPKKSEKEKIKKKELTAKKCEVVDGDEESEIETDNDDSDKDYHDGHVDSGDDDDMDVDGDANDSDRDEDRSSVKKRKADASVDKKAKKKAKVFMTDEEKVIDRRTKAAEYREKKARERAEAQGLEYIKGKVGRKSKAAMLDQEQIKFTKCEEVFLPMMERLSEAKEENNIKVVLKCIKSIMERVEMLTPPFLREYPLGMLVKTVRKSFEGVHPEVKENCKGLTAEMKRVYTEKDPKVPDDFEPVKNKNISVEPMQETSMQEISGESATSALASSTLDSVKSEPFILNAENVTIKTDKVVINADKVDISSEPSLSKRNSEMSLSESLQQKMAGTSSAEFIPDVVKSQNPPPKQKRTFSIKGMFDKPKLPAETPKTSAFPTSSSNTSIATQLVVPKPKSLPPWVIGPPIKVEDDLCSERAFGLEFLSDAVSSAAAISKKFDPISVSQSLERAIFAETKMRGRHWNQYWEKIHDIVFCLSPGKNKPKAIMQGIIRGDYQDPSDVVKLSRRDILKGQMVETAST